MGYDCVGKCVKCSGEFNYCLLHNGFNDSAYAYCDRCGKTAVLSGWYDRIPEGANLKLHQKITPDVEPFLKPCDCGGSFTHDAGPRCPHCRSELSVTGSREFIEKNALGSAGGWKWQDSWEGLYCIAIQGNDVLNNWK